MIHTLAVRVEHLPSQTPTFSGVNKGVVGGWRVSIISLIHGEIKTRVLEIVVGLMMQNKLRQY